MYNKNIFNSQIYILQGVFKIQINSSKYAFVMPKFVKFYITKLLSFQSKIATFLASCLTLNT